MGKVLAGRHGAEARLALLGIGERRLNVTDAIGEGGIPPKMLRKGRVAMGAWRV